MRISARTPAHQRTRRLASTAILIAALLGTGLAGLPSLIRAVMAQVGPGVFSLAWNAGAQQNSSALAWGDVDNDGDLDLAVGNYQQPSQLYRNNGGTLSLDPAWAPAAQPTRGIAWADVDGDGDLDLALANDGAPSQLYRNNGGTLSLDPTWAPAAQPTRGIAWADVNGDGYPDLALANYQQPSQLYLNNAGSLAAAPSAWNPNLWATSVAWADVDGDGDLDLAITDQGASAQIYPNNGGALSTTPLWTQPGADVSGNATSVVAFGDLNGDGDPDLVIGNNGAGADVVQIYRSCAIIGPGDAALCPGGAGPTMSNVATIAGTSRARSLDIGDVDGDGDLDLIVGRDRTAESQLFLNSGDGSFGAATALGILSDTSGLALADADGDSDLDLAVANYQQANQLFRNNGGLLALAAWAPATAPSTAAAWADVDGDGDLDLALANDGAPSQLYLNDGSGALTLSPAWSPPAQSSTGVAWADVDGDGDLDLALANNGQAGQLYVNNGGTLTLRTDLWSPAAQPTRALAWADVDGDGDLDLALANDGAPSQLYLNDGSGALTLSPAWSPPAQSSTSIAWGDINGDSLPDLLIGNNGQPNQLYRNSNGTLTLDADWQPAASNTASVAWADFTGDGQLDLVVGNEGQPNQLYVNLAGVLTLNTLWVPAIANTRSVAPIDVDGDGDIDLAVGNSYQPSQLYINNGAGVLSLANWAPDAPSPTTRALAWADVDGDGDPDLAMANYEDGVNPIDPASRLYLNGAAQATPGGTLSAAARSFNRPPTVSVARPDTAPGDGLSAARISATPTITIGYRLADPESDPVPTIKAFYSLDDGGTWRAAAPAAGTQTTNLSATPAGQTHTFVWDTAASGFFGQSDTVRFRIRAYTSPLGAAAAAGSYLAANRTPGPLQQPFAGADSARFRARGTQVRVIDESGAPVPGAIVYRLPAGAARGGAPLVDNTDEPILTNGQGYLGGSGQIAPGDRLAAMLQQPVSDQYAEGKYRLFYTSPIAIDTGLPAADQRSGNLRTLTIPRNSAAQTHPLILLDLSVGTEWNALNDSAYREQLQADLRRVSELLYDWTDGQVALGQIDLYLDGPSAAGTDIRIYATNRLRPGSDPGGIVRKDRPWHDGLVYTIGNASIGASWNRYGGAGDTTGEDWPRALAHELSHFALYQEDNYIGRNSRGQLVTIPETAGGARCPGAMSNPYNDSDSEFVPQSSWGAACANTFSQLENGRSDWATILTYYPMLRAPAGYDQNPGPSSLSLAVTTFRDDPPGNPTLASPTFTLVDTSQAPYVAPATARVRAVLYTRGASQAIDLGRPTRDQLLARGAQPGDQVCVYNQPDRLVGCATVAPGQSQLTIVSKPTWNPDISITPLSDRAYRVSLPAASIGGDRPAAINVRFFPRGLSAPADGTLSLLSDKQTYAGDVTLSEPTAAALVRLWVPGDPDPNARREALVDLTLYGTPANSLAALDSHKKPKATVTPVGNSSSACPADCAPVAGSSDGQLLIYADPIDQGQYYTTQTASVVPTAPPWSVVVGQAYRLISNMSRADMAAKHAAINISYLEAELPPGTEGGLAIYYWDGLSWTRLESTRHDVDRNEVAADAVGPGLYALLSRVEVSPGWNYVSYPWPTPFLVPTTTLGLISEPNYIEGLNIYGHSTSGARQSYTTIHSYLPTDTRDPWKVFDVDAPFWVNDLRRLEYGEGYWFIVPPGGATPPALAAAAGPTIGVPVPPATFYGLLPYHGAPANVGLPVQAISDGVTCASAETFVPTGAGRVAYLIEVPPAGQGAPAGCGISGQTVTIVIGGVPIGQTIWDNSRPITFRDSFLPLVVGPPAAGGSTAGADNGSGGSSSGGGAWVGQPLP